MQIQKDLNLEKKDFVYFAFYIRGFICKTKLWIFSRQNCGFSRHFGLNVLCKSAFTDLESCLRERPEIYEILFEIVLNGLGWFVWLVVKLQKYPGPKLVNTIINSRPYVIKQNCYLAK